MGRLLVAFILVVSLVGCGGKIEENDGAEITTIMKDLATSVETGIGVPRTTEEALKYIRTRVDQSAIIKAYAPPTIVRTNPAIHVNRLLIRAGYDINRKLFTTSWALKHDDKTSAWTLSSTSFRDIQRNNLRYKPEDALIAALGRMGYSTFMSLEPDTGWESPDDVFPLLAKTFQALVDDDQQTLLSVTVRGALLRAGRKGIDLGRLIAVDVPDMEFDPKGATDYLKERVKHTSEIMKYCQAELDDILPYINAYSVGSMPEHCNRVTLSIEFSNPDKGKGMTVGKRAMMGFTVEWSAVRLKDVWLIDDMIINCLVTDTAKSLYDH
jgi:hypothetical protein